MPLLLMCFRFPNSCVFFCAFEITLSAIFRIWRFCLCFHGRHFPLAKGEGGKANIDIAIFYRGDFLLVLLMNMG